MSKSAGIRSSQQMRSNSVRSIGSRSSRRRIFWIESKNLPNRWYVVRAFARASWVSPGRVILRRLGRAVSQCTRHHSPFRNRYFPLFTKVASTPNFVLIRCLHWFHVGSNARGSEIWSRTTSAFRRLSQILSPLHEGRFNAELRTDQVPPLVPCRVKRKRKRDLVQDHFRFSPAVTINGMAIEKLDFPEESTESPLPTIREKR